MGESLDRECSVGMEKCVWGARGIGVNVYMALRPVVVAGFLSAVGVPQEGGGPGALGQESK